MSAGAPGAAGSSRPEGGVDLLRGYEIVAADPEWPVKLGLFLVIWIVPLLGWFVVLGWLSYGARRAVANLTPVLLPPSFDLTTLLDYGEQGLKAWVVSLVWSIPAIAIVFAGIGCLYFGLIATFLSAALGAEGTQGFSLALIPVFLCGGTLVMAMIAVINALLSLPAGAAALRAELSGLLARGFDFEAVLRMVRLVLRDWIVNLVLLALFSVVAVMLANFLPLVGIFVSTFLLTIIRVFAAVSVYEKYLAAGGEPVALGPMEPRVGPGAQRR